MLDTGSILLGVIPLNYLSGHEGHSIDKTKLITQETKESRPNNSPNLKTKEQPNQTRSGQLEKESVPPFLLQLHLLHRDKGTPMWQRTKVNGQQRTPNNGHILVQEKVSLSRSHWGRLEFS
ncbi:hypothetical protein KY290_033699 [Solanum tuberosum]|uniref:Uncharacterized protein n=1 Tax=Solanum tuberosum TaxID=4113 RepID=A0ABQ7U2T2_SOLTU|nr:hypothetical protein KY289_033070 [Solanum tuberosum]KAH0647713.1 hypothetical protein KY285_032961 [Solanum tuberosum]KAH0740656.1 hypothetical protein KY290_033699 [Solanum tuberosum]